MSARIVIYDVVDSTMDEARRLLQDGVDLETIVLAKSQDGGRGRQGRSWISPAGNLFMSLITRDVAATQLSQFALLWGEVVRRVVSSYTKAQVQCKWPNDVLINGNKVGGILIERHGSALIVGVGINIEYHPQDVQFPATCLKEHSQENISPEGVARKIWDCYLELRGQWEQKGFGQIRNLWLQSAWKLKDEINIRQNDGSVVGIFEAIDETGAILLKDAAGAIKKLYVGDLIKEV